MDSVAAISTASVDSEVFIMVALQATRIRSKLKGTGDCAPELLALARDHCKDRKSVV